MIRRLVRVALAAMCLLSLLACLATVSLWSYAENGGSHQYEGTVGHTFFRCEIDRSGVELWVVSGWPGSQGVRLPPPADEYDPPLFDIADPIDVNLGCGRLRAGHVRVYHLPDGTMVRWSVPGDLTKLPRSNPMGFVAVQHVRYWLLATIAVLPALLWFAVRLNRERVKWRRRKLAQCPACGYDLRATPDRCPECGAVPPKKAEPA